MFSINEKVVYPGHGVAIVSQTVEKNIAGHKVYFYELTFLNKDMTILIPMHNVTSAGIRRLASVQKVYDVFTMLAQSSCKEPYELNSSNWNKRNKEYQYKLRTGSLDAIGMVYCDLKSIAKQKELSFGEKNLLQQTESLLVQEISLVIDMDEDKAVEKLRSFFALRSHDTFIRAKQRVATAL